MRIVLDTNVLVSGIFFAGPPGRVLDAWAADRVVLVASPEILDEYRRVVEDLGARYPAVDAAPILSVLTATCEICIASPLPEPVSRDTKDEKFIACAISAGVSIIVSGDKDLLDVSGHEGLRVLKPKAFLDQHLHE